MPNIEPDKGHIKELVFNGGGARGIGMPGVYYALKTTLNNDAKPIWEDIETIAGTSVGSLTAVLFSVGIDCEELTADVFENDILQIVGINQAILPFNLSLDPLKNFLNNYLCKHIKNYLQQQEPLPEELEQLLSRLDVTSYEITFTDLALLNQNYPEKFKNIIITSTSAEQGDAKLHLYNHKDTPTFSIAQACAASCALPFIFKSVKFDDVPHIDGGCAEPLPSEQFHSNYSPNDAYSNTRQSERLLFVFGPGPCLLGKIWHRTLHGRPSPELVFCDSLKEIHELQQSAAAKIHELQQSATPPNPQEVQQSAAKPNPQELQQSAAKPNPLELHIYINQQEQNIHYFLPNSPSVLHQISFNELNIPAEEDFMPPRECESPEEKDAYYKLQFAPYLINFQTKLVQRKHLPSILGDYSPIWLLNYFDNIIKWVIGVRVQIATLFESLCQRLRTFYTPNTVILNSTLIGISFQQAGKTKRTIAATYYLDTMNHLALYNFAHPGYQNFHHDIVENYLKIYQTYLDATNMHNDHYAQLYQQEDNLRILYEMIKDDVSSNPTSPRAMALTYAVELYLKQYTADKILAEINDKARSQCQSYCNFFCQQKFNQQDEFAVCMAIP